MSVFLFSAGIGIAFQPFTAPEKGAYASSGDCSECRTGAPHIINNFADFLTSRTCMASPGTVAVVKHFKITGDITVGTFPIGQERNLANHIILYGEKGSVPGARVEFTNLHTSLFHRVLGPNTVIKNIEFRGNGNIAREFSGIMDNVHHISGSMQNLNVSDTGAIGGLVDISNNATFRHSSNSANVLLSTGGGTRPVNGGIIGEARGNLHISNTFNQGHIETFLADIEATGGLVGRIANNTHEKAVIVLSYNTGEINGRRSGGLIGKKEGNGELEIRESYNTGWIRNRDTTRVETAGILAWATGGLVYIGGCYNRGNVTTTGTTTTTGSAGIFSTNNGAIVTIQRTYNTGTVRHAIAVSGGGVQNVTVTNSFNAVTPQPTLGSAAQVTIPQLSDGLRLPALNPPAPASPIFMVHPGGTSNPPVLVGLNVFTYTFHANGGTINTTSGPVTSERFTQANWATVIQGNPVRNHFDFLGWSEDAQAEIGIPLTSITVLIGPSKDFYAVWKATEYDIVFVDSGGVFVGEQDYSVFDGEGVLASPTSASFVIGQSISLRTNIREGTSLDMGRIRFVGWRVNPHPTPDGTGFGRFTYGNVPGIPTAHSARFDIWESNGHIIDSEFIGNYTHNGVMTVRGMYEYIEGSDPIFDVTVEAVAFENGVHVPRPSWGVAQIDDGNILRDFPSLDAWIPVTEGESAVIRVKPNEHYSLEELIIKTGGSEIPVTPEHATDGFYVYELDNIDDDYTIRVVLKRTEYKVTITAQTVDGAAIPEEYLDELIGTQRTFEISIGSTFNDIVLSSSSAYRLFHQWDNNYKINLPGTTNYSRRSSETNGQIIIRQTEFESFMSTFWGKGWDPDTDEIEIIAIYVRQVELSLAISSEDFTRMGTVVIEISHPDPQDTFNATMFNGVPSRGFRYGSIVEIFIELFNNARVQNIKVNDTGKIGDLTLIGDIYQDARTMSFTFELETATFIDIAFEIDDYVFSLSIVDETGSNTPTQPLPIFEKVEILDLLHADGREWRGENLADNDVIRLTLEREIEWRNDWVFDGVWIIYDGDEEEKLGSQEHVFFSVLTLIDGSRVIRIELDDVFVGEYLEDVSEFTIEVRFIRILNINIRLALPGSGNVVNADTGLNLILPGMTSTRRPFPVGTTLKIRLVPNAYYELPRTGAIVVDNLNSATPIEPETDEHGSYIELVTSQEHDITVHYVPEQRAINTSKNQGNGEIKNNNLTEIGIGTEVIIQFKPSVGLQRSSWKINGVDVGDIQEKYNMAKGSVRIRGNTVSFTVNEKWFSEHFGNLHSEIGTEPNTMLIVLGAVGGVVVILLIVGLVFMIIANKKRRAEYALAREKMKIAKARMGHADMIKGLREG